MTSTEKIVIALSVAGLLITVYAVTKMKQQTVPAVADPAAGDTTAVDIEKYFLDLWSHVPTGGTPEATTYAQS